MPICTPGLHSTISISIAVVSAGTSFPELPSWLQNPVLPTNPQLEVLPGERFGLERFLGTIPKDSVSPIASVYNPIVSIVVSPKSLDPISFPLLDPRPETGIFFCL